MKVVEVRNLTLSYNSSKLVLNNVSFDVERGEFIVILGRIGSGKTSLLKILSGLIPHIYPGNVKGEVYVCGKNILEEGIEKIIGCVGLVIDDPSKQIFNLTVEDDIAFGPLNMGCSEEEIYERTRSAIKALGLNGLEKRNPRELSGGQQQRVALAGAFALRPKLLVLDEPISMLDPLGKLEVLKALRRLNRDYGVSCIITESGNDLEEVIEIASRIIVLNSGKIIADGEPEEVLSSKVLEKIGFETPFKMKLHSKINKLAAMNFEDQTIFDKIAKYLTNNAIKKNRKIEKYSSEKQVTLKKPVIEVRNVRYIYPNGVIALKSISLSIHEGEMLGIIGQNGSGKTTLALVMAGVFKPSSGDVLAYGKSIWKYRLRERIRIINYVFQNPDNQLFSETIEDEVAFALKALKTPETIVRRKVEETLKLFGLEKYKGMSISGLTKDLKALTALASIYILEPKVLIIDEPTNGLDFNSSIKIMETLKKLTLKGKTVIIISHNMKLIHRFCNRVVVIHNGQLLLEGKPEKVFEKVEILSKISIKPPPIFEMAHELATKLGGNAKEYRVILESIIEGD